MHLKNDTRVIIFLFSFLFIYLFAYLLGYGTIAFVYSEIRFQVHHHKNKK